MATLPLAKTADTILLVLRVEELNGQQTAVIGRTETEGNKVGE